MTWCECGHASTAHADDGHCQALTNLLSSAVKSCECRSLNPVIPVAAE